MYKGFVKLLCIKITVLLFTGISLAAITIDNTNGTGSGVIKLFSTMPPNAVLLDSCNVSPGGNCQLTYSTIDGYVLKAEALLGSFFIGWGNTTGNINSCNNSSATCNVTGATSTGTHSVVVTFNNCDINLTPTNERFSWRGGNGTISITSNIQECEWSATSSASWVRITSASNGTGSGAINYTVSTNRTQNEREAIISIGGKETTIKQLAYLPYLLITPEEIEFGNVKTNTTSERQITVRNINNRNSVNINSIQVSASNSNMFSVAHNCSTLSPLSSCTVRLSVKPQSTGAFNGTLVVNSDDPYLPEYRVEITGNAGNTFTSNIVTDRNSFDLSPIDIEFGDVKALKITNTGTGSLLIDSVRFVGRNALEFNVSNTCPIVEPGGSCNLIFNAHYLSNEPKEAYLVIRSNAENLPIVEIPVRASSPLCMSGGLILEETSKTVVKDGGSFNNNITRTGESGCIFFSTDTVGWLSTHLTSTALTYEVQANNSNQLRMENVKVGGEVFTVIQHKDASNRTFDDITGNYFENYINAIYTHRITIGCIQDVSFCPLGLVTRGEMSAFIIRALQGENFNYTMSPYFTDVPVNHTFFKYVQKMKDLGITVVSGQFRVNDQVTRGEMAAFIIRAIFGENFSFTQTPYFSDVPSNHIFFKYVQKMRDLGITVVTGTYRVDDYVTREEMSAFLSRAFLYMR